MIPSKDEGISEEEKELQERAKRGLSYLLMQRHSQPGCKGWELKRILGKNYQRLLSLIEARADELGLRLVVVPDEENEGDMARARYVLVSKYPVKDREMGGWLRMEEAASLAIALTHLYTRGGSESKEAILAMIKEKLPAWRAEQVVSKLVRLGYLEEDAGYLKVGKL